MLRDACQRARFGGLSPFLDSGRSHEQVAIVPECVECGARGLPADEERWQQREVDLDELAWYCAECAEREFGDGKS